jgi:hypothetical protein
LRGQHFAAGRRDLVVAAPPLPRLLHPPALDQAALLEAIEHRIERCHVKSQLAVGAVVDEPRDLVTVPLDLLEARENHELGAAALEVVTTGHSM